MTPSLWDMEANTAPGFTPNSRTFFTLIRTHAIRMFETLLRRQREHGRLIGFPGIGLDVPAAEQRADVTPRAGKSRRTTTSSSRAVRRGREAWP